MSTTTENTHDDLPESGPSGGTGRAWRVAKGTICRGRDADGTLETVKELVGELVRVGIHRGKLDSGKIYAKVEADLKTKSGEIVSVGSDLDNKTASLTFAEGLTMAAKGGWLSLSANQSTKPTTYGNLVTYSNWSEWHRGDRKWVRLRKERRATEGTIDDRLDAELEELMKHPAYAPRPNAKESGGAAASTSKRSALDELETEIEKKGLWPGVRKAQAGYDALAVATYERVYGKKPDWTSIEKAPDDVIDKIREGHATSTAIPPLLKGDPALFG